MNNQKTYILSYKTVLGLYTAFQERIERGWLPENKDGIHQTIDFYHEYFLHYQVIGCDEQQREASSILKRVPYLRAVLKWRIEHRNTIFYSRAFLNHH
jgi:glucuronate isomerase